MRRFLIRWAILVLAFFVTDALLPNLKITGGFFAYVGVAAIFGLVNATLGTILRILTFPITLLTLGLFALIVNAAMITLTANLSSKLETHGFLTAVLAALIITVVSAVMNRLLMVKRA